MTQQLNYESLRNSIHDIAARAGYSGSNIPLVSNLLDNVHVRGATRLAEIELPTLGYDVTPVFDLTLQYQDTHFRNIRTAIRRTAITISEEPTTAYPSIEEY